MRTAAAGFLFLAASVAGIAAAADGLIRSWQSHPVPNDGKLVVEFFADGTALFTHEKVEVPSPLLRVRESKQPGLFELTALEDDTARFTFHVKAPGVAVLTTADLKKVIRMIPGGFDD